MKKRLIISGLTGLVIATTGAGSLALASADSSHAHANHAAKSQRTNHHIRMTAKLNQAVRDGTITDTQKTAFETEMKSLRAQHQSAISKSSTVAEREAERVKLKSELQSWASTNNFPLAKIFPKLAG